jgi:hypothetical protein
MYVNPKVNRPFAKPPFCWKQVRGWTTALQLKHRCLLIVYRAEFDSEITLRWK